MDTPRQASAAWLKTLLGAGLHKLSQQEGFLLLKILGWGGTAQEMYSPEPRPECIAAYRPDGWYVDCVLQHVHRSGGVFAPMRKVSDWQEILRGQDL